jgi:signal transduction protein with GAF and PtsI domain
MIKIAEGISCSSKVEIKGELVYVKTIEDVIELFDKADGKICIVDDAGITTLGPILSELCATVCTTGGAGSHLAIVSREFGLPCIMSAKFLISDLSRLQGKTAKIVYNAQDKGCLYLMD